MLAIDEAMKTAEFVKIGKQLLPHFPAFVVDRDMLLRPPLGDFVCGVCLENASGTREFWVRPLFMPLFIPRDHIAFWCDRIRWNGRSLWNAGDPDLIVKLQEAIQAEAMPFLNSVSTLSGALEYQQTLVANSRPRVNSNDLEALAYTLIKAGHHPAALKILLELEQRILDSETPPWLLEIKARARLMKEKLSRNPEEALAQLEAWKAETKSKLKLEKYP